MTSETCAPSTSARLSVSWIATFPNSWAARLASAPLKAPTGVRAAATMTISSFMSNSLWYSAEWRRKLACLSGRPACGGGGPPPTAASLECGRWPVNWKDCRPVLLQLSARSAPPTRPCPRLAADKTVAGLKKNRLCCPTARREPSSPMPAEPVTIKKYANRRLYNTGTSTYVTLEDLAAMVKAGEDFIVHDAKTGEDITRQVLAQIIFEQENKEGQSLLPIAFLRQLIRFYGDSMQMLVPRYLEVSIDSLTREQQKFRDQMAQAFGGSPFGALEDQVRRNMEMFERAFAMFTPFGRREGQPSTSAGAAATGEPGKPPAAGSDDIEDLK